ncbi:MAG: hypothetical protein A2Y79_07850 [Deltaproteobacteria bacterium RBG_13_43_22]|nr:MAG: hypothetical protein A2Y79_07850 [Deltaproteobacteria bacterium RBG_13_43_22]
MKEINVYTQNLKKVFFLSIISFTCFLIGCNSETSAINRGHRWYDRGKFNNAVQTYSHALKINPSNPDAYYFRGLAKYKLQDIEGAEADFSMAIKLNPTHIGAYINRGHLFNQRNEFDKALSDCNKAIGLSPNEYRAYLVQAEVWFYKRDFDKSIADCNFVLKNNPQMAVAYRDRADAFYWKLNYSEATRDYLKAVELDQKDSFALNNLAWILATCEDEKIRDGKEALVFARKAVDIDPSFANLSTLAAAYAENRMFDEAVKIMKKIVSGEKDQKAQKEKYLKFFQSQKPIREKPVARGQI